MWTQIKKQAVIEKKTRKMFRAEFLLFLVGLFFFLSCGLLVPVEFDGDREYLKVEMIYSMFLIMAIYFINYSMLHINEGGKSINIFRKMKFTPVDYRIYIGGKLYLMWKELFLLLVLYQGTEIGIRIAAHLTILSPGTYLVSYIILCSGIVETVGIFLAYLLRNKSDILV